MVASTFLMIFFIMLTLAFIMYIYYAFQKFYLRGQVIEMVQSIVEENVIYDSKKDEWYFVKSVDGGEKELITINFSAENSIEEIYNDNDTSNKELEDAISAKLADGLCTMADRLKREGAPIGMLNFIADKDKFTTQGTAIFNDNYTMESENFIGVRTNFVKTDYTIDENNEKEILYNEKREGNQLIKSTIKAALKIRIKSAYPFFLFLDDLPHDLFIRNGGTEIKRAFFDVEYKNYF